MEQLAIKGGSPVRNEKIFYGHQWIDEEDIKAVSRVLCSDYLTGGERNGARFRGVYGGKTCCGGF